MLFSYRYNLGQNICRPFHVFAQFLLTTSESELDYYHQKMNVRVATRDVERPRELGNLKKMPEMLGFDGEYPGDHPKGKF